MFNFISSNSEVNFIFCVFLCGYNRVVVIYSNNIKLKNIEVDIYLNTLYLETFLLFSPYFCLQIYFKPVILTP